MMFAAFLRGMNVGGHRLTNADLRACFEAMDLNEVATFRASGNVVFAAESHRPASVQRTIEEGLEKSLGYAVPTFIRSASEMREIAAASPFPEQLVAASKGKLQVALLARAPTAKARREVLALADPEDRLVFGRRELYWLPQGGVLESPLDMKAIAGLLGTITMRTKNTVEQLTARHFAA